MNKQEAVSIPYRVHVITETTTEGVMGSDGFQFLIGFM